MYSDGLLKLRIFTIQKNFKILLTVYSLSLLCGSIPNAIAGRLSVKRLINSRCTGANGTGNPAIDAQRTAKIAPKFPDDSSLGGSIIAIKPRIPGDSHLL